ncbi:hypothetical protein IE53DRAFT_41955 [Violaceomyces palustris]|uniref:Uncharacterized protein n=1 Tax=Violaceomyces palustris TaxID=1673888 RepID=A0ACD0P0P2_9BASI|nr:hypothetical protein IE53DRAFT_41955 [Violaceomyces palustris]
MIVLRTWFLKKQPETSMDPTRPHRVESFFFSPFFLFCSFLTARSIILQASDRCEYVISALTHGVKSVGGGRKSGV